MERKNTKMGILVAILVLAIGFATVTTTLYINGTIKVAPDEQGFKDGIVFASAKLTSSAYADDVYTTLTGVGVNGVGDPAITFSTGNLKTIGEKVTLTYTIANNSSYNAKIGTLNCGLYFDSEHKNSAASDGYLTVTPKNVLASPTTILGPKAVSGEDTVEVEMVKSYAGTKAEDGVTDINSKTYYVYCTLDVESTTTDPTVTSTSTN